MIRMGDARYGYGTPDWLCMCACSSLFLPVSTDTWVTGPMERLMCCQPYCHHITRTRKSSSTREPTEAPIATPRIASLSALQDESGDERVPTA
ncbi:hypothetical protein LZ32DRAFT_607897 [Colletotrichum eremochloae]|nr:hypothetical protein LZ32DRAFT_607897 [Colletotrichum eremochloae]